MDYSCALEGVERDKKCSMCAASATMDQFKPDQALKEGIEALQKTFPDLMKGVLTTRVGISSNRPSPASPRPHFYPPVVV